MALPGTRVVHPRWSEHHRPVATSAMTATCTITRPAADGITGNDGSWTPGVRTTIYTGPCRVVPEGRDQRLTSGDDQITRRRYSVFVEWDAAEARIGDQILITEAVDPLLAGKAFRLVDILHGSEQWQRNLMGEEVE